MEFIKLTKREDRRLVLVNLAHIVLVEQRERATMVRCNGWSVEVDETADSIARSIEQALES